LPLLPTFMMTSLTPEHGHSVYPSGVGRLLRKGEINDASVFDWGVVRESVHKFDYGHKFAGATATPVMA
jgi:hypothetical protein